MAQIIVTQAVKSVLFIYLFLFSSDGLFFAKRMSECQIWGALMSAR